MSKVSCKILAVLMALLMLIGMLPVSSLAVLASSDDEAATDAQQVITEKITEITSVEFSAEDGTVIASGDEANTVLFGGDVTATIKVDSPQYYSNDYSSSPDEAKYKFAVVVTKEALGETEVVEYRPAGIASDDQPLFAEEGASVDEFVWDNSTAEIKLTADGEYSFMYYHEEYTGEDITAKTGSNNVAGKTKIVIDKTAPVVTAKASAATSDEEVVVSLSVDDVHFTKAGVAFEISRTDYNGNALDIPESCNTLNWVDNSIDISFTDSGIYTVSVTAADTLGNISEASAVEFIVDGSKPVVTVEYAPDADIFENILNKLTLGFTKLPIKAKVTVADEFSAIAKITLPVISADGTVSTVDEAPAEATNSFKTEFSIPDSVATDEGVCEIFSGYTITAYDQFGNIGEFTEDREVVVDTIAPQVSVSYGDADYNTDSDAVYSNLPVTPVITVTEKFFNAEDITVSLNGSDLELAWATTDEADTYTAVIGEWGIGDATVAEYDLAVEYSDPAGNAFVFADTDENIISENGFKPVFISEYETQLSVDVQGISKTNPDYFESATVTVTLKEHELLGTADEVVVYVNNEKTAVSEWVSSGDEAVATFEFDKDGTYEVTAKYSRGTSDFNDTESFMIDNTAPTISMSIVDENVFKKLISAVTFGIIGNDTFDINVFVTDNADTTCESGVDTSKSLALTYTYNDEICTASSDEFAFDNDEGYVVKFTMAADGVYGGFEATAYDIAGNKGTCSDATLENSTGAGVEYEKILHDSVAPEITVSYETDGQCYYADASGNQTESFADCTKAYFTGKVTPKVEIKEEFFFGGADVKIYINGEPVDAIWTQNEDGNHVAELDAFEADGEYTLELSYSDATNNAGNITADDANEATVDYKSKTIVIDNTAPEVTISYVNAEDAPAEHNGIKFFNATHNIVIEVKEKNFDAANADINALLKNIEGKSRLKYTFSKNSWAYDKDTDSYKATIVPQKGYESGLYDISVAYTDCFGNKAEGNDKLVIDLTAPKLEVTYSQSIVSKVIDGITFGFYDAPVTVKVKATDSESGVNYIKFPDVAAINSDSNTDKYLEYKAQGLVSTLEYSFQIPQSDAEKISQQFTGYVISAANNTYVETATEDTNNVAINTDYMVDENGYKAIVVDNVAPEIDVEYQISDATRITYVKNGSVVESAEAADTIYYSGTVDPEIRITEDFFLDHGDSIVVSVKTNGKTANMIGVWEKVEGTENVYRFSDPDIKWTKDGEYQLSLNFTDYSGNSVSYSFKPVVVDTTEAVLTANYDASNHSTPNVDADGMDCYKSNVTGTFTVKDTNFSSENVTVVVKAQDINGNVIEEATEEVTGLVWTENNGVWSAQYIFTENARYSVYLEYVDYSDKTTKTDVYNFAIDRVAPEISVEFIEDEQSSIEFLESGNNYVYWNDYVTVKVTAKDNLSGIGSIVVPTAVDPETGDVYPDASHTTTVDVSKMNRDADDNSVYTYTFTLPDTEGITAIEKMIESKFSATDNSGNKTNLKNSDVDYIVVDTIAPGVSVKYTVDADTVVTDQNGNVLEVVDGSVANFRNAVKAYFSDSVTPEIIVEEDFFFDGTVIKKGNGIDQIKQVKVTVEFTDEYGVVATTDETPDIWTPGETSENGRTTYTGKLEPLSDGGHYKVKISYKDHANNAAQITAEDGKNATGTYTSKEIIIDKTAPTIKVDYINLDKDVQQRDGKDYYHDANRKATITVTEHNFDASKVKFSIVGKDIQGNVVKELAVDSWRTGATANTHVAEVNFGNDAIYTLDLQYADYVGNTSAGYKDEFVLDKTAPSDIRTVCTTRITEKILGALTFGFYKSSVDVTATITDNTAGIDYFTFTYERADGVSTVNTVDMDSANYAASQDGNKFTATYTIKAQARGNVTVNAVDNAGNAYAVSTAENTVPGYVTPETIVVDDMNPICNVEFGSAYTTDTNENISYYDGNIPVTITINEANFFSEDVTVNVTRNDVPYDAEDPVWTDGANDTHVGTFTLAEDGHYMVTVEYIDNSGNTAEVMTVNSTQLTIDKLPPVINVESVGNQTANNAETIGFRLTVSDVNIDASDVQYTFKAYVMDANGTVVAQDVDLGTPATSTDGEKTVLEWNVDNFDIDGYYTFSCSATDKAGHTVTDFTLDDTVNGTSETVQNQEFSVNRAGSAFKISTEHTDKNTEKVITDGLNGQYANGEVTIIITETNIDKVNDSNDKKTVVTINDGASVKTIDLTSGNYTKNTIDPNGGGGWYTTVYTLDNSYFANDGKYSINIISYDKAGNTNLNTASDSGIIEFTVDRTAPVVMSNISSGQGINAEEYLIKYMITEANLDTKNLTFVLTDNHGNVVDITPEELGNNEYGFTLSNISGYSFTVKAVDLAGNESELFSVENFTISTNILVLFWANQALFWGVVGGVLVLGAGIVLLIVFKKKKKEQE